MYLVELNFIEPARITDELTQAHRAHLAGAYLTGELLLGGRKEPRTGGYILSNHRSKADLTSLLEEDPFYQSGVSEYTISEFIPVLGCEALQALI